jgi:AcrR family transcriptional regulator
MNAPAQARRGRPLDPAVGEAVLAATRELLSERGYDGLRVDDVAERAHAGLGALYRRWPTKRALVLAALSSLAEHGEPSPRSGDPRDDLLAILEEIATAIASPDARAIASLLLGSDPELAAALREAKLIPQLTRLRERLRAAIGDVADLDLRVELGPALIAFRALILGHRLTRRQLRDEILPQILRSP